jgi:hypothetical protein
MVLTLFNSKQIQDFVLLRRGHGLLWLLPISRLPIDLYLLDAFYVTCPSGLLLLLVTNMTTRIYVIMILFLLVVRSLPYEGDVSILYSTLASCNRTPSPSIAALSVGLLMPAVVDTRTFTTAIGAGDTVPIYTILCTVCLYVSANLNCESERESWGSVELKAEAEGGTRRAIVYFIARSAAALAEEDAQGQEGGEGDDGRGI